ncbi:hypothetical protein AERO8C_50453 [Aeromonas veronii]|uniref:Uncharacterized protein n=1 Tax=Aeromonas veronii TaxID=654 RepID=A0A653L8X3_AERVE|nr:hypothetical protein AERO8C_50453 [Aeromonas veronii]
MARPALGAGRLLEPASDCWPRGMIATRGNPVQNPAYRPTPTSFRVNRHAKIPVPNGTGIFIIHAEMHRMAAFWNL